VIIADIEQSPIGRLVPIEGYDARFDESFSHFAYVPDPLPQSLQLSDDTWMMVVEAERQLGRLDEAGHRVPDPEVVRRPQIIREAQSTSALEGTHVAFTEIVEAEMEELLSVDPEMREVLNYIRIASSAVNQIDERRVTIGFLNELQSELVAGTESDGPDSGRIRTKQVFIGPRNARIVDARFVPAPAGDLVEAGYRAWSDWMNDERVTMPAVVRTALGHYQFETLHPYADGNGRLGRLVILLQLLRAGIIREALLTVSPWFEDRRTEYQDQLLRVSQTGDYDTWVRFFAQGLRDQAQQTVARIEALMEFAAHVRSTITARDIRGTGRKVAEDLIANPVVWPAAIKTRYGVSYVAANNAVARLVEAGLIEEVTGRRYDRVFVCTVVHRIVAM